MRHCLNCGVEVEEDDNFCPECGHWTTKGYTFLEDKNSLKIINGKISKKQNRIAYLIFLMLLFMILSICMCMCRGKDILKPFIYIKREFINYKYGYNTTILNNTNQYYNQNILTIDDANKMIGDDLNNQIWQCRDNIDISKLEKELEKKYDIIKVAFCEMSLNEAVKIKSTIDKIYNLFPDIKGFLTNISITNAKSKTNYVAYFQPIYQFVNSTNNINEFNKVNKSQILLNSYYFLNEDTLGKGVKEDWYVKDATYESLIAHEFGHYITYVSLLKTNNINSTLLETKENKSAIKEVKELINNGTYAEELVNSAIKNYNYLNNTNLEVREFASLISNYAKQKNSNGNYIYDEIIAEAVHDYYLHGSNSSKASLEIISILKEGLKQ